MWISKFQIAGNSKNTIVGRKNRKKIFNELRNRRLTANKLSPNYHFGIFLQFSGLENVSINLLYMSDENRSKRRTPSSPNELFWMQ